MKEIKARVLKETFLATTGNLFMTRWSDDCKFQSPIKTTENMNYRRKEESLNLCRRKVQPKKNSS